METAKDKAKSLVEKFKDHVRYDNCTEEPLLHIQVKCAKIAVDEILNLHNIIGLGKMKPIIGEDYKYWQEVKNELNKM